MGQVSANTQVPVNVGAGYEVVIGEDLAGAVAAAIAPDVARVAIIHPPTLTDRAAALRERFLTDDRTVITIEIPDGERAKTAEVLAYCWSVLGQSGFTRQDLVIGFGGGSTTDLAGFVAASWLRGVPLIQMPTTLLAMVDAAVGGKTGINTDDGKNLVGAFYSPKLVAADVSLLAGMPELDYVAGLAEVIKCGLIADPEILRIIAEDPSAARNPQGAPQRELIRRAVEVKARVVADDFGEDANFAGAGQLGREVLNYGHTLAHAIERAEKYEWRHGAAVSVGMVYAAELARLAGRLDQADVDLHREVLTSVGLPISYAGSGWDELSGAMKLDKKTRGDLLRFVILEGIGRPTLLAGPDPAILIGAFGEITGA